jgi:hypothetical protein
MPATNASTLALAAHLRALDDNRLSGLLRARFVRENGVNDFFDLADRLLDRSSIQAALASLDRSTLAILAIASTITGETDAAVHREAIAERLAALGSPVQRHDLDARLTSLEHRGLAATADGTTIVWDSVAAQLAEWPSLGLPDAASLAAPWSHAPVTAAHAEQSLIDSLAAERAFATAKATVELVVELRHEPARELAKGGLAIPDLKRLASAAAVDLDEVQSLHSVAARAGLIVLDTGLWLPTDAADDWMVRSTPDVWSALAVAWLHDLPRDIRRLLAGRSHDAWDSEFHSLVSWQYPAAGDGLVDAVAAHVRDAEQLGIIARSTPSTPGALLLEEGADAATAAMARLLPHEVRQVYLQHDLSIVSPGPLAPRLDARLRTMAAVESQALASSYRVSLASINRALTLGETAQSITEFLRELSLTGIPQPLSYLIAEASARYGQVRVGTLGASLTGASSYVRSSDPNLLGTILVDQNLSALGLLREGDRLTSRFDADTVFWSLNAAKYPVAAETATGEIVAVRRRPAAAHLVQPSTDHAAVLVERLRTSSTESSSDNDRAWLERQLDAAVKARLTITVSVTVQDGSSVDYVLEPTGMGGGRLRARDRKADIERTLPLSRITAVSGPV